MLFSLVVLSFGQCWGARAGSLEAGLFLEGAGAGASKPFRGARAGAGKNPKNGSQEPGARN